MYTVLRLARTGETRQDLEDLTDRINSESPTRVFEPQRKGTGYAAELSGSAEWSDHHSAIDSFVRTHREALSAAHDAGAVVVVDVAIEPEDLMREVNERVAASEVCFSEELIGALADAQSRLIVTLYP